MTDDSTAVLRGLLADTHEQVASAESEVHSLEAKVQNAKARLHDLHVKRDTLELASAAITRKPAEHAEPGRMAAAGRMVATVGANILFSWAQLSNADSVAKVLSEATAPMSPTDIAERLAEVGKPQPNTEPVRAALAYLKSKNRAKAIARSSWILVGGGLDQHEPTNSEAAPAATETASDSIRSDTEGGDADGAIADRVLDLHSSRQAIDLDHGSGAAMTGG